MHELKQKGVALRATEQPVDTSTAAGKAFMDMLGMFAEFETNLRRERQLEGIKAAKEKGAYKGRKPIIDEAELRRLRDKEKLGSAAIARRHSDLTLAPHLPCGWCHECWVSPYQDRRTQGLSNPCPQGSREAARSYAQAKPGIASEVDRASTVIRFRVGSRGLRQMP